MSWTEVSALTFKDVSYLIELVERDNAAASSENKRSKRQGKQAPGMSLEPIIS
jgi:hypothetical protein